MWSTVSEHALNVMARVVARILLEGEREFAYRSILDWLSYTLLLDTAGPAGLRVPNVIPLLRPFFMSLLSVDSMVQLSHYTLI